MPKVITYRLAYHDSRVDLCERHAARYRYPLGPVEHGSRRGSCEECERAARKPQEVRP